MAKYKSHHFVPKCYLRNFAADAGLCSINLFNLKTGKFVERASIKDQCAKNYLYGKDPSLEQSLQGIEGKFADCMRQIVSGLSVDQNTLNFLRDFSLLQFLRTDIAFRRQAIAMSEMADLIFEHSPEQRPTDDFDHASAAMESFLGGRHIVSDLRIVLIINKTITPFLTSDDPAVTFNKFYVQKVPWKPASGLNNSGYCIFLTLTPDVALLGYDADVYSIFSPGNIVNLEKKSDIDSFNELIAIKSNENIYFQKTSTIQYVKDTYNAIRDRRPTSWHRVHYAILDSKDSEGKSYRVVHTEEDRRSAKESLIHVEGIQIQPRSWPSILVYRPKPLAIDTKSGAGFVRRGVQASTRRFLSNLES